MSDFFTPEHFLKLFRFAKIGQKLRDSKDRNLFVRDERRTIAMTANAQNQSNSATLCVLKRLLYSCLALNISAHIF